MQPCPVSIPSSYLVVYILIRCGSTGYNLPSLRGHRLVLDFQTIAAIYMNEITMWNDQRIIDINTPEVSALLPNESIIVVTLSAPSETTKLFTSVLRATVPKFASEVGGGSLVVTFPVQKAGGNRSIVANSSENMMNQLIKTPKSFGFSRLYDVMLVRFTFMLLVSAHLTFGYADTISRGCCAYQSGWTQS